MNFKKQLSVYLVFTLAMINSSLASELKYEESEIALFVDFLNLLQGTYHGKRVMDQSPSEPTFKDQEQEFSEQESNQDVISLSDEEEISLPYCEAKQLWNKKNKNKRRGHAKSSNGLEVAYEMGCEWKGCRWKCDQLKPADLRFSYEKHLIDEHMFCLLKTNAHKHTSKKSARNCFDRMRESTDRRSFGKVYSPTVDVMQSIVVRLFYREKRVSGKGGNAKRRWLRTKAEK